MRPFQASQKPSSLLSSPRLPFSFATLGLFPLIPVWISLFPLLILFFSSNTDVCSVSRYNQFHLPFLMVHEATTVVWGYVAFFLVPVDLPLWNGSLVLSTKIQEVLSEVPLSRKPLLMA